MNETGVVDVRGRQYKTVALRVSEFRDQHPSWSLITEILDRTDEWVVMRAQVLDESGRVLATGHAEENRKASQINKTSALENCETSAIGRALAALGYGGTEFASADELANAIVQQGQEAKPREGLQPYPDDRFEATFPAWDGLVSAGRKTAQDILAMVGSKYALSEQQRARILALGKEEVAHG